MWEIGAVPDVWMLLGIGGFEFPTRAASAPLSVADPSLRSGADPSAPAAGESGPTLPSLQSVPGGPAPEVHVYLHPGRSWLGRMDLERVLAQLELEGAAPHRSLSEAERAAGDGRGFLVEVRGAFIDAAGRQREGAVFFSSRLRDRSVSGGSLSARNGERRRRSRDTGVR